MQHIATLFAQTLRNKRNIRNAPYDLNKLAHSEEISIIVASDNLLVQIFLKSSLFEEKLFILTTSSNSSLPLLFH